MRSEAEVAEELRNVRAQRERIMPTQTEPLAPGTPAPAGYWPDAPGGEVTELLEREAGLVIERAEIRRAEGAPTTAADDEDEKAARRILQRIAERR